MRRQVALFALCIERVTSTLSLLRLFSKNGRPITTIELIYDQTKGRELRRTGMKNKDRWPDVRVASNKRESHPEYSDFHPASLFQDQKWINISNLTNDRVFHVMVIKTCSTGILSR